jgi:hypothetical protein
MIGRFAEAEKKLGINGLAQFWKEPPAAWRGNNRAGFAPEGLER